MTTTSDPRPHNAAEPADPVLHDPGLHDLVDALERALALCAAAERPPGRVRVGAGGMVVDISWPIPAPVPVTIPAPGTAPSAAATNPPTTKTVFSEQQSHQETALGPVTAEVRADTVGTFHRSPAPGAPPFVQPGEQISAGQQLAIIEVMKLMVPVEAKDPGTVLAFEVEDGQSVQFGQLLLTVGPPARPGEEKP